MADFNGDHNLDVAIAEIGGVNVLLGNGDGTFQAAVQYSANFPDSVAVAVFNGDHKLDLVAATFLPGGASVFPGQCRRYLSARRFSIPAAGKLVMLR